MTDRINAMWLRGRSDAAADISGLSKAERASAKPEAIMDYNAGRASWFADNGAEVLEKRDEERMRPMPAIKATDNRDMWRTTHSGRKFYFYRPEDHDYFIGDIAHHLAQINRWGGACVFPYSVAQHSTILAAAVYEATGEPDLALDALFHDAEEAYFGDIVKPLKVGLPAELRALPSATDTAIRRHFKHLGVPPSETALVSDFDKRIVFDERAQCLAYDAVKKDVWPSHADGPLGVVIQPTDWLTAKHQWLMAVEVYVLILQKRNAPTHPIAACKEFLSDTNRNVTDYVAKGTRVAFRANSEHLRSMYFWYAVETQEGTVKGHAPQSGQLTVDEAFRTLDLRLHRP